MDEKREQPSPEAVNEAIREIPQLAAILDNPAQLRQLIFGRDIKGIIIPPYVEVLGFEPGELVIEEGNSNCNSFFFVISGAVEATSCQGGRINRLNAHEIFGLRSLIFGSPRNATVRAIAAQTTFVLEFDRSALKILRSINTFDDYYDAEYRAHGKTIVLNQLKRAGLTPQALAFLERVSTLRAISTKDHLLCQEESPMDRLFFLTRGWIHRQKRALKEFGPQDHLGPGICLGLEGVKEPLAWPYTVTLMGFNEYLEVPVDDLRQNAQETEQLIEFVRRRDNSFVAAPPLGSMIEQALERVSEEKKAEARKNLLLAQSQIISTGVAETNDLLVMDMDLCVHCGRCSFACHEIHGQSRLTRRGLQITRPSYADLTVLQTLLIPQTCIHCQNAKCLPGCPTGAIKRMPDGTVDIDPATCIGCRKCSDQCPYNAISMIVRPEPQQPGGGVLKTLVDLKGLLKVKPEPLPPTVEETQQLVAVKCDRCQGCATLNPEGKSLKYGCEENCMTGALTRVHPTEYFSEIVGSANLRRLDERHLVGRNIHRDDPTKRTLHVVGITVLLVVLALAVFGVMQWGLSEPVAHLVNLRWLTGWVGGFFLLIVMAYPVRRKMVKRRAGPLRYWLIAHYYAAVITVVLFTIHSGLDFGGFHTMVLLWAFDGAILTGVFGAAFYKTIPRLITRMEEMPVMLDDLRAKRAELQTALDAALAALAEPLRREVRARLFSRGFLLRQYYGREYLTDLFEWARQAFSLDGRPELKEAVETAVKLRRTQALIYLHYTLKCWLPVHLGFAALMLPLMFFHIYQVLHFR